MKERRYGLVISIWNMEPMTGYELLKHVRSTLGLTRPRSSWSPPNQDKGVIAAKAGVNNYIIKGVSQQTSKIEAVFSD